ncbi:MAG: hypothetical protein ABSH51_07640 [Solirubrobacteraceae bacterium]
MTVRASAPSLAWPPAGRVARPVAGWWRWAALPLGVLYLVLLATRFRDVVATANLDADTVSAPVIGQLFASAPAHAGVVLGEFGWYASLLFELATKWLPSHRQIWEAAPYAMSLAGFALTAWAVWRVAGRWAASLAAVLLVCAAPQTLHLMLSMTQHAPDWFCLSLLGAVLVLLERRAAALRWTAIVPLCLVTGTIVGANAASDPLVVIAAIVPFALALIAGAVRAEGPDGARALRIGLGCVAVTGIAWAATAVVMAALDVGPERGVHTTMLATGEKILVNLRLWSESIAVLGNGDFFGARLSFSSGDAGGMARRARRRGLGDHAGHPGATDLPGVLVYVGGGAQRRIRAQRCAGRRARRPVPGRPDLRGGCGDPGDRRRSHGNRDGRAGGNLRRRARRGGGDGAGSLHA